MNVTNPKTIVVNKLREKLKEEVDRAVDTAAKDDNCPHEFGMDAFSILKQQIESLQFALLLEMACHHERDCLGEKV